MVRDCKAVGHTFHACKTLICRAKSWPMMFDRSDKASYELHLGVPFDVRQQIVIAFSGEVELRGTRTRVAFECHDVMCLA